MVLEELNRENLSGRLYDHYVWNRMGLLSIKISKGSQAAYVFLADDFEEWLSGTEAMDIPAGECFQRRVLQTGR